jgi:SAM-dependent methyltransferase
MLGPLDLIVPPTVILTAIATLPYTIIDRLVTFNGADIMNWAKLKHAWFKHFWWWFGPATKPLFAPGVRPLLPQASGVVLDIGPASGIWMPEFGEAVRKNPGRITKIYGIEPNVHFHSQLSQRAKENGLEGIYEPIAAYAQDLESKGIKKGSIDTIITVHVLCSVGSQADSIVKQLYEYLKPGGQWLVFEHVAYVFMTY